MNPQLLEQEHSVNSQSIIHLVCTNNCFVSICGSELAGEDLGDVDGPDEIECIVCADLWDNTCPRCGEW